MAKRPNPFVDDYVQQSKVYVSFKQFNNTEEKLQKVYEKTLQKLFKGAKKTQQNDIKSSLGNGDSDKKDGFKQLFIGSNGNLIHSGQMVKEDSTQSVCKCGRVKVESCTYCEKTLCAPCILLCTICQQTYCTDCCLYGSEDAAICVSCYR